MRLKNSAVIGSVSQCQTHHTFAFSNFNNFNKGNVFLTVTDVKYVGLR